MTGYFGTNLISEIMDPKLLKGMILCLQIIYNEPKIVKRDDFVLTIYCINYNNLEFATKLPKSVKSPK